MVGPKRKVDVFDALIAAGFAALVGGIAMISLPAALIAGGVLLMIGGLAGSAKGDRG